MTSDQAVAMLKWLEVLFLAQLAVGVALIVIGISFLVVFFWRGN
jgi:hypothetical protein